MTEPPESTPPASLRPSLRSLRPTLASGPWFALALAVATGITTGIGTFTFRYANGLSYFSKNPRACVNCHIMQSEFTAWEHSSHRAAAGCIDCHLPEAFIPKYIAKAENGFRHARLFTTQTFHEPITVKAAGLAILQENCIRCHGSLVHELVSLGRTERAVQCVHCHAGVGHVERAGMGGPLRPDELEPTATEQPARNAHPSSDRGLRQ